MNESYAAFFETLGLPRLTVHHSRNHFDFRLPSRRILVVGPMGSGKTEHAAQIWRDSRVALHKDASVGCQTAADGADLRRVFFVRSRLDRRRFRDYPEDALAYRGGYERLGGAIADISNSFELEALIEAHPGVGTWVLDEAGFYDERVAYVIQRLSDARGLVFVIPTLILNFRNAVFNATAALLLETATDVHPLTAYCEHASCLENSSFTYRYYTVEGTECPALYFDPLIIIGGDRHTDDAREPNYATRCAEHHVLPGKEYSYLVLKPLGEQAAAGRIDPLVEELSLLQTDVDASRLGRSVHEQHSTAGEKDVLSRNALRVPCLAERALVYLYAEQNLLSEAQIRDIADRLDLDKPYLQARLADNRRPIKFEEYSE